MGKRCPWNLCWRKRKCEVLAFNHEWTKNRGIEDILIACVDGLNGFLQAIEAVSPKTKIQQCIIYQIRNSTKFVSYKDIKKLMADLKLVYAAPMEETALNELELFKDKWDSKYPKIYKFWNDNWATLSTYFKYPEAVRCLIYTQNTIEGFNRQLRKVTKNKTVFPSDDSLLKMLYLETMDIKKNEPVIGRTGDRSIPSLKFILKNVWQDGTCKTVSFRQVLLTCLKTTV